MQKLTIRMIIYFLLLVAFRSFGQIDQFNYNREISGINNQWHKIVLPNDIFGKVSPNLSDIRIFGIISGDTIEAPFLLQLTAEKILRSEISFIQLNTSRSDKGYFFTFEVPSEEIINKIELDFEQLNFDWKATLEGSQNQLNWFAITEDYRILSIKNGLTDFNFTTLNIPDSKFRFYRILVKSEGQPNLTDAKIYNFKVTEGTFLNFKIKSSKVKEDRKSKTTIIDLKLEQPVPINRIKVNIKDTFDFYRPVNIKYLQDSVNTELGRKYNYRNLATGTLNSLEENEFSFSNTILQNLKIEIYNADNQPLTTGDIEIIGYVHELVIRFTEPADYYLVYGNNTANAPQYDIAKFINRIPLGIETLKLAYEENVEKTKKLGKAPLFENKTWLWIVLTAIILLLGYFCFKMMREKHN